MGQSESNRHFPNERCVRLHLTNLVCPRLTFDKVKPTIGNLAVSLSDPLVFSKVEFDVFTFRIVPVWSTDPLKLHHL